MPWSLIPGRFLAEALAIIAILGGAFLAGHHGDHIAMQRRLDALHQQIDRERAQQAQAAASASEAYRATEEHRQSAVREIAHVAQDDVARARADAVAAADAAGRLRQRAAQLAASCGATAANPAAAPGSAPAAGPGLVLSNMLGRADDMAGELAAAYDRARIAGQACERAYDALR